MPKGLKKGDSYGGWKVDAVNDDGTYEVTGPDGKSRKKVSPAALKKMAGAMKEADDGNLDERVSAVRRAVREKYADGLGNEYVWADVVYDDHVIVRKKDELFSVAYKVGEDGTVELTADPIKVKVTYSPIKESRAQRGFPGWVIGPVSESGEEPTGAEWDVIVISAGVSGNGRLYERNVLEAAIPKYESARMFLDHQEEPRRFGRSTKDLVGFLRDVRPVFVAQEAEGQSVFALAATACLTKKSMREELLEAWRLGKPDLFGLSHDIMARSENVILESGDAVLKCQEIQKVKSVDYVTNPAAGGRVMRLVASHEEDSNLERDSRMFEKLMAQLKALKRPDLLEALWDNPSEDQLLEAINKAMLSAPARSDAPPQPTPTPAPSSTPAPQPIRESQQLPAQGTVVQLTEAELSEFRESRRTLCELRINNDINECSLPDTVKTKLKTRMLNRVKEGYIYTQGEITEAIKERVDDFGALAEAGVVLPGSRPRAEIVESRKERINKMLDDFFDPTKDAVSFRECYIEITGDKRISGKINDAVRLTESLNTGSFDQVLGDSITRRMLPYYQLPEFANWELLANVVPLNDFRVQRRVRFGGYGNLPIVAQGGAYTNLTSPTDEEATYSPAKRGGLESITLEMIRNDDVGAIRDIPRRLGRAAAQTLYEFVLDFLALNSVVYDSVALAAVGHNNIVTTAMSASNIMALRNLMKKQTDMSNAKRLGLGPRTLWVPTDLEELAFEITMALLKVPDSNLAAQAAPAAPNFIKEKVRLNVEVVDYWTDTNNYWVTADKNATPLMEIGFLDGQRNPEIFVQDMPNVGSMFNSDQLTWKLRHIYGGTPVDYRGFGAGIVP